jgi:hypothetical protein
MKDMSERDQAMLHEWTRSACDAALHAGLVESPWRPSERVIGVLQSYYVIGMTPAEGAEALFATRH